MKQEQVYDPTAYSQELELALSKSGLEVTSRIKEGLMNFILTLLEKNKQFNLTALTSPQQVGQRHLLDSWALLPLLDQLSLPAKAAASEGFSLIDVGTGAGFPGLALKFVRPEIDLVLLDSLQKRVNFLQGIIEANQLEQVEALHGRAEDLARQAGYREHFDFATARAVASLPELSEYCLPFVKVGGYFIAMKSAVPEEIEAAAYAIKILGGRLEEVRNYILPGTDLQRSLIIIRKIKLTASAYPRRPGKPRSSPLLAE